MEASITVDKLNNRHGSDKKHDNLTGVAKRHDKIVGCSRVMSDECIDSPQNSAHKERECGLIDVNHMLESNKQIAYHKDY